MLFDKGTCIIRSIAAGPNITSITFTIYLQADKMSSSPSSCHMALYLNVSLKQSRLYQRVIFVLLFSLTFYLQKKLFLAVFVKLTPVSFLNAVSIWLEILIDFMKYVHTRDTADKEHQSI
jgi:hypothetical protein